MSQQDLQNPLSSFPDEEGSQSGGSRRIPPIGSLLHVLWLRKWAILAAWTLVAIPAGVALSIFDLPKSYSVSTVLRFPSVVGAQTNVMRDVAITQGESIISIFNSFQVLEATIRKLNLRMRVAGPKNVFYRNAFESIRYGESLGLGRYYLQIGKGREVALVYRPRQVSEEYTLFNKMLGRDNKLTVPGLELVLKDSLVRKGEGLILDLSFNSIEESAIGLRDALSARPLGTSNYEIKLKDRDPWMAAEILNTLREEFLTVYYGTTEVQDVGILVQMEKDLELSKVKLEKSQDELSRYYAAHPELMQRDERGGGDNLTYLESRQDLDRLAQLKRRVTAAYRAKPDSGTPEQTHFWALELLGHMTDAGEPRANILRASLAEMQQRQAGLKQSLGPDHPRITEVESEKAGIFVQVEETFAALVKRLDQDEAELKQRMAGSAPIRQATVPVKVQLELERLNTVNTNNQNIYDRLMESYNRAKLTTGSEFFKVTVVDPARPGQYLPASLKTRLLTAIAVMAVLSLLIPAVFVGWAILFLKVWTKDDVRRLLRLKSLGTLGWNPSAAGPKGKPPAKAKAKSKVGDAGEVPSNVSADGVRPPHPLLLFYGSSYTVEDLESYRHIREETESYFRSGPDGKYCLLITSTRPNEGKTTMSANLAMTFARKGKRTLLIDADFRLGRVDKVFNTPASTGVDELLGQGDLSDGQFLESASLCFMPTMQRNLVIAPRSRSNPNAGELVSSDRFKAFIRLAREQFDVVLIDTPPIMITPEPLSLTEVVDGVLFVCLSGGTVVSEVQEAIQILEERGTKVGVVLNGLKGSPFEANRYKKYSYYYQVQPKPDEQSGQ